MIYNMNAERQYCDFYTSCEYTDGKLSHMIRWMTFPDGTAIELCRMEIE
jgi:hypothetical protein